MAHATCTVPGWPDNATVNSWPYSGAREKCFCAYATMPPGSSGTSLDAACPSWKSYVSTDNITPGRVKVFGQAATVLGVPAANATPSHFGSMSDWSVDLGSGLSYDCNTTLSPGCVAVGAHVLSIPRRRYFSDCCGAVDRPAAGASSLARLLQDDPSAACSTLSDMLRGGLAGVPGKLLQSLDSCRSENQDPVDQGGPGCLAQCFHFRPDVNWVHVCTV